MVNHCMIYFFVLKGHVVSLIFILKHELINILFIKGIFVRNYF